MDSTVTPESRADQATSPHIAPRVSIALAVYNGGEQLRYAIQSLLDQTQTDWELLILDDGSSDGSVELIKQFTDPRIRLICDGQNRGLATRLNQAIDLARGQYFARMDHDDICDPERFEHQLAFLQANPQIDLLAAECVTMNEASELNGRLPAAIEHQAICRRPWLGFYMPHPTWMGKLTWFRQHRYPEPAPYCCEDQELLLRTHRTSKFHTFPKTLLAYRVRTQTPWKKLWRTRLSLCQVQVKYFYQHRQWFHVCLSITVMLLRLSSDAWRKLRLRLSPTPTVDAKNTLDPALAKQWQRRIQTSILTSNQQSQRTESSRD